MPPDTTNTNTVPNPNESTSLIPKRIRTSLSFTRNYNSTAAIHDFPLPPDQLSELHNPKSLQFFKRLFNNDPKALYRLLRTDPETGICLASDKQYRETTRYRRYGDNRIPDRTPKTFIQLVEEGLREKTMVLLSGAACLSFLLGLYQVFYQPPQYDPEGNEIRKVDWIEGVAIMIAVVVVVLVGAINDYQKELQFMKLNRKKEDHDVVVVRNGHKVLVSIHDLLVGDVLSLQTGDVVPADCILIDGACEVDESSTTGESDTIKKVSLETALTELERMQQYDTDAVLDIGMQDSNGDKVPDCMLISGSNLLSGLGKAVVTAVGTNSIYGKTMMSLKTEPESTPLQQRLSELTDHISVYGCFAALLLFIVLLIRYLLYVLSPNGRFHDLPPAEKANTFVNIFITSVAVIAVAIPEGLPLAVTLALSFATTRMTADGNLVRVLRACETMGSATTVCSDKTGTLTENVMTVVRGMFGNDHFDDKPVARSSSPSSSASASASSSSQQKDKLPTSMELFDSTDGKFRSTDMKNDILANITLNSTAFENVEYDETAANAPVAANEDALITAAAKGKQEPYIGSKTETALLGLARRSMGLHFGTLHLFRTDLSGKFGIEKIVQIIPFESTSKWGGIVVKFENNKLHRFYIKGAAEIVLRHCKYRRNSNGELVEINDEMFKELGDEIKGLANNALRAISFAHQDFPDCESWPPADVVADDDPKKASPEKMIKSANNDNNNGSGRGPVFDGLVGIQDPVRPGVRDSVGLCQKAGVTVRMVTGDNILTARAIAKNCQILDESASDEELEKSTMEGPKFRKLTREERLKFVPSLRVLARSSPEDKRLLVETLKGMGEVVAVTGDGTNDAPALKLADVGFSMGISGTEVAREASDIILMTDDFSAIVNAIKWGRCVSVSIKKFIQFQLTVNITAVVLTFVSSVTSADETSVLTAVQLLWVNLIMDTLAALALATDKPDPNILDKKPQGRRTPLITLSTWKMILGQSLVQLVVTLTLHYCGPRMFFPGKKELTGFEQQQLNAMTFNAFVWLQFFTMIVARKLDEGDGIKGWKNRCTAANLNFFQDLFRNYYFLAIMALIGTCQVLIMFFGGAPFSIAPQTKEMWITAVGCGMISLPVGVFLRACPDEVARKYFPKRFFQKLKYLVGLEFLRRFFEKDSSGDEEHLVETGSSASSVIYQ